MKAMSMDAIRNRQHWVMQRRGSIGFKQTVYWLALIGFSLLMLSKFHADNTHWEPIAINYNQKPTEQTVEAIFNEGETFCTLTFIRCSKGNVGLVE